MEESVKVQRFVYVKKSVVAVRSKCNYVYLYKRGIFQCDIGSANEILFVKHKKRRVGRFARVTK